MSARLDHTNDPVSIALRRHMKGQYLHALSEAMHENQPQDGLKIVVYGSTLMRELVETQGATLPFAGVKSSDIDIGAWKTSGESMGDKSEFEQKICPYFRRATEALEYDFKTKELLLTPANEVAGLSAASFYGDHYVSHSFTEAEAKNVLGENWEQLEEYFKPDKSGKLEVHLSISPHGEHFPIMMDPIPMHIEHANNNFLYRADRYDMLAGKLARCLTHDSKATDLIDTYNLSHGTLGDGKPILEMGQDGLRDHREVLRLLIINRIMFNNDSMPRFGDPNILSIFEENSADSKKLEDQLKEQIASHRQDDIFAAWPSILESNRKLFHSIFPEGKDLIGPFNLRREEVQYVMRCYGLQMPPMTTQHSEGGILSHIANTLYNLVGGNLLKAMFAVTERHHSHSDVFDRATVQKNREGDLICELDTKPLEPFYREAEKLYPGILQRVSQNPNLNEQLQNRMASKDFGDFAL